MTKIKGGAPVVRQNFSMHRDLVAVFLDTAIRLNGERANLILADRSKKVTYSKVAAAIAWYIQRTLLTGGYELTAEFRQMVADYEASPYENTDLPLVKRTDRHHPLPSPAPMTSFDLGEVEVDDDDEF